MHRSNGIHPGRLAALIPTLALTAALAVPGCGRKPADALDQVRPESTAAEPVRQPAVTTPAERQPGPFTPPPLEALDRDAKWIDRPVRDGLALLREQQKGEPVLASVAEALALRNESAGDNAKILSALGRLPEDGQADLGARIDRHTTGDLGSTNPIMISTSAEFDVLGLTGFGLFSFDRALEPFATSDTVSSWQTSADEIGRAHV